MAPKRKAGGRKGPVKVSTKAEVVVEEVKEVIEEEAPATEAPESDKEEEDEKPSSKKAKTEEKKTPAKRGRKGKAAAKPSPKKKATKDLVAEPLKEPKAKAAKSTVVSKVIIEASKECNSIKIRAAQVQTGLKEALPGLEVVVNPDKPRKGCFEIRDQDGNAFLSLLGMPRPYTKLKSLDLDKTVEEIVAKIK